VVDKAAEERKEQLEKFYEKVQQKLKENRDKVKLPSKTDETITLSTMFDAEKEVDFNSFAPI